MQAEKCPGEISAYGGILEAQEMFPSVHLAKNGHPEGFSFKLGGDPGMDSSLSTDPSIRGKA